MSLATRCTACGTVFRVVQDQLKASEGWVRCGRCNEVFNALEGLFDLGRDAPPEDVAAPQTRPAQRPRDDGVGASFGPSGLHGADEPSLVDKIDAQLFGSRTREDGSTPATRMRERDRLEFPDARFDPDLLADTAGPSDAGWLGEPPETDASEPAGPEATPEFVRRARREARWRSGGMRAALAAACVILLTVLSVQAAHHFRDVAAARWPVAQPALAAWCALWSCAIDAPRRIEDVSVESSSLTRAATPDAFRLSVALRNRAAMTVALPSVELSLTDAGGQLVARRVLGPHDFRSASTVIAPGAETALQLVLAAGGNQVTGYTVEVFYP